MRVLLVCPYDWDAPGGVQVHVRQLAERLLRRGHAVRVLAPCSGVPEEPWVRPAGRPLRIPYRGTVAPVAPLPRGVRRQLAEFEPDVVHVHEPFAPSVSMWAALISRVPVVATFHAYLDRSRLMEVAAPLMRRVARRIDVAIAVSEAAAGFSARRFGLEPSIIPNGVDVAAFAGAEPPAGLPEGRILLWVNRLDPQKGFRVALDAFGSVATEVSDLHMVVAGDGPERNAVDRISPAVRPRVHMLGRVEHRNLPGYFAAADIFVSPATGQESFGIVLVEAMAAGASVVASDIPGYREVAVAGENALLVPPNDARGLASAIRRLLDDPDLAARLASAGRERASTYSWDQVVPRIEDAYARASGAARSRRSG